MLLYQLPYKESMWTQPRGFPLIFVQSRNKKLNWEFTCSDLWHRKGQALVYLDALWSEITASMGGKTSSILYILVVDTSTREVCHRGTNVSIFLIRFSQGQDLFDD